MMSNFCAYFGICTHIIAKQIPPLSRTLHFPGPNSFFRTFQVLEILQTQFQDFPGVETLLQVREVNRVKQLATSLSNSHAIWDHTVPSGRPDIPAFTPAKLQYLI